MHSPHPWEILKLQDVLQQTFVLSPSLWMVGPCSSILLREPMLLLFGTPLTGPFCNCTHCAAVSRLWKLGQIVSGGGGDSRRGGWGVG